MPQYTEDDRRAFVERDRRIVAQSSLERATEIVLGTSEGEMKVETDTTVEAIEAVASRLVDWVYAKSAEAASPQASNQPPKKKRQQQQPPKKRQRKPTPKESELLAKLLRRYDENKPQGMVADFNRLQAAVWQRYGMYPTKESSIDKLYKEIPARDVLTQNEFVPPEEGEE